MIFAALWLPTLGPQPALAIEPPVRVSFSCYAIEIPAEPLAFVARPGEAAIPVTLYRAGRSPRYTYVGPLPIRFFDAVEARPLPADTMVAAPPRRVLAEAHVPPGMAEALLLLLPNPDAAARREARPFRVLVLDDSSTAFPPGRLRVYNASGRRLSARIERQNYWLETGLGPLIPAGAPVQIELRTPVGDRSYPSYRGLLNLGKARRCLLIILPPRYPGSPEVEIRVLQDEAAN